MSDIDPRLKKAPAGTKIIDYDDTEFETFDRQKSNQKTKYSNQPTNNHVNPLQKHFRIPGLSIKLPSGSYYYDHNDIATDINGEIDIYPMTTGDELLLKNPDALLNGRALELLIQSCVPQIKNVRGLISQDLDIILLAIRTASSGTKTTIEPKCPECGADNCFEIDIRIILDNVIRLNPPFYIQISDNLYAEIRPYNFEEQTVAAITAFEEGKKTQQAARAQKSEQGLKDEIFTKLISESMHRVVSVKFSLMANCIQKIVTDEEEVTDKDYIIEFIQNAPKKLIDKLVSAIEEVNNLPAYNNKLNVTCTQCNHIWEMNVDFNPSNFFD